MPTWPAQHQNYFGIGNGSSIETPRFVGIKIGGFDSLSNRNTMLIDRKGECRCSP